MNNKLLITTSLASVALMSLTACGSSTSSPKAAKAASASPSLGAPLTDADIAAALLKPSDIGTGFTTGTYSSVKTRLPCDPAGTTPLSQRVPAQATGGTEIDSGNQAALTQTVNAYADAATGAQAWNLFKAGVNCTTATLPDGSKMTLQAPVDVTAQVSAGHGSSLEWQWTTAGAHGVMIATFAGRVGTSLMFAVANNASTAGLPDPVQVAKLAFEKLAAH